MLLNFQKQFALKVTQGLKRQTIRAQGKRRDVPKVGDMAHCYTGLRTKSTRKLGSWRISRVDVFVVTITPNGITAPLLNDVPVSAVAWKELALADGFDGNAEMTKWFFENHPPQTFAGWVIGWEWTAP